MTPHRLRWGLALVSLLSVGIARAEGTEQRVALLISEALETDYLGTDFDGAAKKLSAAVASCERDTACPKRVLATAYRAQAIVFAGGLEDRKSAVEAFRKMLLADKTLGLDPDYELEAISSAFAEARRWVERGIEPGLVELTEAPWTEQALGKPIPVFVTAPPDTNVSKVAVYFKAPGEKDYTAVALERHGDGFGGYIPCKAVTREGKVHYYVVALDKARAKVAVSGTEERPHAVLLKPAINSRQPALPKSTPPAACVTAVTDKLSCEVDDDCPGAEICEDYYCHAGTRTPSPAEASAEESTEAAANAPASSGSKLRRNWLSAAFAPDIVLMKATEDACSPTGQHSGEFGCYYSGGQQYVGTPEPDANADVTGGFALGSMRALIGYDRVVGSRFQVGARLGFAFLGNQTHTTGGDFLPYHASGRFAFFFGSAPFESTGVKPFVYATGGLAQVVGRVTNAIRDAESGGEPVKKLDTYERAGIYFAGLGGGLHYAVSQELAMIIDVAAWQMFPEQTTVLSPSFGATYGF